MDHQVNNAVLSITKNDGPHTTEVGNQRPWFHVVNMATELHNCNTARYIHTVAATHNNTTDGPIHKADATGDEDAGESAEGHSQVLMIGGGGGMHSRRMWKTESAQVWGKKKVFKNECR
jgi:hypothetical protein